eukprot:7437377-Alexandrium_andersonii.AAC.1
MLVRTVFETAYCWGCDAERCLRPTCCRSEPRAPNRTAQRCCGTCAALEIAHHVPTTWNAEGMVALLAGMVGKMRVETA